LVEKRKNKKKKRAEKRKKGGKEKKKPTAQTIWKGGEVGKVPVPNKSS